ncbi:peroxiredoxin family protein [Pseudomonadota bacterium]
MNKLNSDISRRQTLVLRTIRTIRLFIILCGFGICSLFVVNVYGDNSAKAPSVDLVIIGENKISLANLRGHPVLLTFWATTCSPCIKEIPGLVDTYHKYHDKGLEVIAVAMSYDPPAQVWQMVQDKKLPYRIALDVDGSVSKAFSSNGIPSTFIIAPNGDLVFAKEGLLDFGELNRIIETYIQKHQQKPSKHLS